MEIVTLYRTLSILGASLDRHVPAGGPTFSAVLREAYEASDLRGLRMARGDLVAMVRACTPAERRELDAELREKQKITLASLFESQRARVAKLRARGRLTSEEQYYLVREYLELVASDPDHVIETVELQRLLDEYSGRATPRTVGRKRRDPAA